MENRKEYINSVEASKAIQADWNHDKLCEFLLERKFVTDANSDLGGLYSQEKIKYHTFPLERGIYENLLEIDVEFMPVLKADYEIWMEEYWFQSALFSEFNELTNEYEKKIAELKRKGLKL